MQTIRTLKSYLLVTALVLAATALTHEAAAQDVNCNGCVNTQDIANDAVSAAKIKDRAVHPAHLSNRAKPAGAEFSDPVDMDAVPIADTLITTVTLNLPAPGVVIVNAGGYAEFDSTPASIRCAITNTLSTSNQPLIAAEGQNIQNARRMPVAGTRGFREQTGGTKTYNLVCRASPGSVDLNDMILTAVYAPRRY